MTSPATGSELLAMATGGPGVPSSQASQAAKSAELMHGAPVLPRESLTLFSQPDYTALNGAISSRDKGLAPSEVASAHLLSVSQPVSVTRINEVGASEALQK